jgi:hypothetical protein
VPKKSKIVQDENERSAASVSAAESKIDKKPSRQRSASSKKSSSAAKKKTAGKTKVVKSSEPVPAIAPTEENIRIRAYFIAERRSRLELAGDANTDWLEAKRQLLSEVGRR